jgi:hypothetical protein
VTVDPFDPNAPVPADTDLYVYRPVVVFRDGDAFTEWQQIWISQP